jgi:hypothetical protein
MSGPIEMPLNTLHFGRFFTFLKDPGPLNSKKRFSAAKQLLKGRY